jgi:hypothetical protein
LNGNTPFIFLNFEFAERFEHLFILSVMLSNGDVVCGVVLT